MIGSVIAATESVRDKERRDWGSSIDSNRSSSTHTGNNSEYMMKSNQFNETIYKLIGLTTYFALKSTNIIAEKASSHESIVVLSAPVTLVASTGSLVAYKPDDSILGENKTTVNNGSTWVDKLKDAALYIKDTAIDTSKLIPVTIILTGYYLNEYKESVNLLKGTSNLFSNGVKSLDDVDISNFVIKSKHLDIPNNTSTWNKFNLNTVDEAKTLVDTILKNAKQDNSLIKSVLDNGVGSAGQKSYKVWIDAGKKIGTKEETALRIVYDELGNIWTVFPDNIPK